MDRSLGRFLCLPIFDGEFRGALAALHIDHVEFWMALADASAGADDQLSRLLPALTEDHGMRGILLNRLDLVNILASMVKSSAARINKEIASDLGYGAAQIAPVGSKRSRSDAPFRREELSQEVGRKPAGQGPAQAVQSLQGAEEAERRRWGLRLQAISARAGSAAGINDPRRCEGLTPAEADRLRRMVFEAGGFRTIRQHVRGWEKFEDWAVGQGQSVYPPAAALLMRYVLHLIGSGVRAVGDSSSEARSGLDLQEVGDGSRGRGGPADPGDQRPGPPGEGQGAAGGHPAPPQARHGNGGHGRHVCSGRQAGARAALLVGPDSGLLVPPV